MGNETIFTRGVNCERDKVKEFGIQEMWIKNRIFLENVMYVGTSFVGRRDRNEVGI